MKQSKPNLPTNVNLKWADVPCFDPILLEDTRQKLSKIQPFEPAGNQIFKDFAINPDDIKLVIVNSIYPLTIKYNEETGFPKFEDYPAPLKEIWYILQATYKWDKAENYLQPDLQDWVSQGTLLLNLSLTNKGNMIWEPFMKELFEWFNESDKKYVFCFLDDISFRYSKLVKNHEIFFKFQPKEMAVLLDQMHNKHWFWGLPF